MRRSMTLTARVMTSTACSIAFTGFLADSKSSDVTDSDWDVDADSEWDSNSGFDVTGRSMTFTVRVMTCTARSIAFTSSKIRCGVDTRTLNALMSSTLCFALSVAFSMVLSLSYSGLGFDLIGRSMTFTMRSIAFKECTAWW